MASEEKQSNASLYSSLSSIQYKAGCSFIETLDLKLGDKVLDMGCGTGELTSHMAKQVGNLGEVVGVDPDKDRIKLAQDTSNKVYNASFRVGDSESGFPNACQAYYDLHFSNHVYHWLSNEQKAVYVKVAFQCLKPRGLMAIQCLAESDDNIDIRFFECVLGTSGRARVNFAEQSSATKLIRECGFTDIDIKIIPSVTYYSSFKAYAESFCAAAYTDLNELPDKALLEEFKSKSVEKDGRIKSKYNLVQIKARKS